MFALRFQFHLELPIHFVRLVLDFARVLLLDPLLVDYSLIQRHVPIFQLKFHTQVLIQIILIENPAIKVYCTLMIYLLLETPDGVVRVVQFAQQTVDLGFRLAQVAFQSGDLHK